MSGGHKIQNFGMTIAMVALIGIFFQNCGKQEITSNPTITVQSGGNVQLLAPPPRDSSGYIVCPPQGIFIEPQGKQNEFVANQGAKYYCLVNPEPTENLQVIVRFARPQDACANFRVLALPNSDTNYSGLMSAPGNNIYFNLSQGAQNGIAAGVYILKVEGLENKCVGGISRFSISWKN